MHRSRWWLVGAGAAVVLIAGGLWVWQAVNRAPTAEEAALGYLEALESGEPGAVEDTGVDVSEEALAAFADATALIEDPEVSSVSADDDTTVAGAAATAEVSFRLHDEEHTAVLSLTPVDGRWTIDSSGLGTVRATPTIGSFVGLGEQAVPAAKKMALLPAEYAVTAAPAALLDGTGAVAVLPGEDAELALEVSVRPEATAAAQKKLDEHLDACTTAASTPPDDCGIRIPWGTEFRAVSEFRYRVEQQPKLMLAGTGFSAENGVLVATLTGTGQDGEQRTTTYRTDTWSLRGSVSFTAEDLALTVW